MCWVSLSWSPKNSPWFDLCVCGENWTTAKALRRYSVFSIQVPGLYGVYSEIYLESSSYLPPPPGLISDYTGGKSFVGWLLEFHGVFCLFFNQKRTYFLKVKLFNFSFLAENIGINVNLLTVSYPTHLPYGN